MKVLIAGGGTGGHIFPAVAIAEAFQATDDKSKVLFVGTNNPLEIKALGNKGFQHVAITVEGLKGRGLWRQLRALIKIPRAVYQAAKILFSFGPDIIIGVGGYSSGPVALTGKLLGKRVVIHEQNCFPGLTNRMVARFANLIFTSFPDDQGIFPSHKVVLTGNPVREDVLSVKDTGAPGDLFSVLIVGGSQGAQAINKAVVEALTYLEKPERFFFTHQTGKQDAGRVTKAYEERGIRATVSSFFTDMGEIYKKADLVICRAGATTVAELTALGKPALFIPFPFAANNHQEFNARYVSSAGGGEVILEKDLDGKTLAEKISALSTEPERLQDMARHASTLGRPHAAERIVKECRRLVLGEEGKEHRE